MSHHVYSSSSQTLASSLDANSRLHAQLLPTAHSVLNQVLEPGRLHPLHAGAAQVKREGRFHDITGELSYDPNRPADTRWMWSSIPRALTVNDARHNELLHRTSFSTPWNFPPMRFTHTATTTQPNGTMMVDGRPHDPGITKRIAIPVALQMMKNGASTAARFDTTFEIDRTEFGLNGVPKMAGFNISIAKRVRIHGLRSPHGGGQKSEPYAYCQGRRVDARVHSRAAVHPR
jgi:polyisoprenoid-binding protein YceI